MDVARVFLKDLALYVSPLLSYEDVYYALGTLRWFQRFELQDIHALKSVCEAGTKFTYAKISIES